VSYGERTASPELLAQIAARAETLTALLRVTPLDGPELLITVHDVDIAFGGDTYLARLGVEATEIAASNDFAVDNLEIRGALDEELITKGDVLGGRFDDAEVLISLIDFEHLDYGKMDVIGGTVGNAETEDDLGWVLEVRGLSQKLQQTVGEVTAPLCRNSFGDERCRIDLEAGTHPTLGIPYKYLDVEVTEVVNRTTFKFEISSHVVPTTYFNGGKFTWMTGGNEFRRSEVKSHTKSGSTHTVELQDAPRQAIQEGDTFKIYKGCLKRLGDCKDVLNVFNRSAEDYLPGTEEMIRRPNV